MTDPSRDRGLVGFAVFVVLMTLIGCAVLGTAGLVWFSHQEP